MFTTINQVTVVRITVANKSIICRVGGRVMTVNLKLTDAQEGIAAFVGKREPEFSHTSDMVRGTVGGTVGLR